jgi:hypothetical protein
MTNPAVAKVAASVGASLERGAGMGERCGLVGGVQAASQIALLVAPRSSGMRCGEAGLDQLSRQADAVARLAQAAFEDIAHAKLASDLFHIDRPSLVDKGRVAGDDAEPFDPRQPGDDVLDNAVDEVFLLGIAAHIGERQYRDRRSVLEKRGRGSSAIVCASGKRLDGFLDAVDAHGPRDVLDAVLAEIGKPDRQLFADLLSHRSADADFPGGGKRLDPRRYIDPVAKHVAFVHHDVADIDADAKADALALRQIGVTILHPFLHDDGAAHGVDLVKPNSRIEAAICATCWSLCVRPVPEPQKPVFAICSMEWAAQQQAERENSRSLRRLLQCRRALAHVFRKDPRSASVNAHC